MQRSRTKSHGAFSGSAVATPRLGKQFFFAGFTFKGDTNLGALASFYGLSVPRLKQGITLAEYLLRTCDGNPRLGYRIALGNAALVIREIGEGAVQKVGLTFVPVALHQSQRRQPHGKAHVTGVSTCVSHARLSGVAEPLH